MTVTATNKKKNVQSVTASQVLKIFARDMAEKKQKAAKEDGTPCLGRGLTPGQDFDLDAPTPKIMSPMEKAKVCTPKPNFIWIHVVAIPFFDQH